MKLKFYCYGKKGICEKVECNEEECEFFDNTGGEPIVENTNADRIRDMSDEELAEFLMKAHDGELHIPFCTWKQECDEALDTVGIDDKKCMACMVAWLQQPAETPTKEVEQ